MNKQRPQVTLDSAVYAIFEPHEYYYYYYYYSIFIYLFIYLFIFIYAWPASTIDWVTMPWLLDRCLLYIAPAKLSPGPWAIHQWTNILYFIFNAEQFIYLNGCPRIHSFRFLTTYYYNTPSNANRQMIVQKHVVTTVCQWIYLPSPSHKYIEHDSACGTACMGS